MKRRPSKLDKAVVVEIGSPVYGDSLGILRRIDGDEMTVEMQYLPPIGTQLAVTFLGVRPSDAVSADVITASHIAVADHDNRSVIFRALAWR